MIVNSENYPNILEAFHCMEEDNAGPRALKLPVMEIPARWVEHLPDIEKILASLSRTERDPEAEPLPAHVKPNALLDSQWYTFINGEYHDMRRMENRDPKMGLTSLFLNDNFEDWTLTGEDEKTLPQNIANIRRLEWLEEVRKESAMGLQDEQLDEWNRLNLSIK